MTVTFNIHNVTNGSESTVLLRKFFQMVFVGNDRKSLHIYTATVLGGRCSSEDTYDKNTFSSAVEKALYILKLSS